MTAARALVVALLGVVAAPAAPAAPALAQSPTLVQGIAASEYWNTGTTSNLLSRNNGRPAVAMQLDIWAAIEPVSAVVLHALMSVDHESGTDTQIELEQYGLRYTKSRALVLDAGRILSPIGVFASRRFADRNPLMMAPDAYPTQYPYGGQISGVVRWFDYRATVMSLPAVHEGYTPDPSHAPRPALSVGVTPYVGVRLGMSYTRGPYLNDTLSATQLSQRGWRSYEQQIAAADFAASVGYLELHSEAAWSSYEVPGQSEAVDGLAYYVEGKYTLHPRLFAAARMQRNDYPFIGWVNAPAGGFWVATKTDFHDEEFGIGVRLSARALLKATYHQDIWQVTPQNSAFVGPGDRVFGVQLSYAFDAMEWLRR